VRRLLLVAAAAATFSCTQIVANDEALRQAQTVGKDHVHLSTEVEKVTGTCAFVRTIDPDQDPVRAPTDAELPDYLKVEAVLMGADTVLVKGRLGEAYVCGPGPLNPDGTLRTLPPSAPPAHGSSDGGTHPDRFSSSFASRSRSSVRAASSA
jgi:hypothetical protein